MRFHLLIRFAPFSWPNPSFSKQSFRNACLFIIPFVRNFGRVRSPFWLGVRNSAITLLVVGGGLRDTEIVNKYIVNKLACLKTKASQNADSCRFSLLLLFWEDQGSLLLAKNHLKPSP